MIKRTGTAQCLPAFLAVLLLLLANSSHIHLRYCLDGAEAPISIHFESAETHALEEATTDILDEEGFEDVESELSLDSLLAKFSKTPTDFLVVFTFDLPELSEASKNSFQLIGRETLPDKPETLLPPPRAPPAIV